MLQSTNPRLLVLICIATILLLQASASTQNRRPKQKPNMDSERRRVEKSVDANNIKAAVSVFNVDMYGATGNGLSDDSKAFLTAWTGACTSTSPSVFLVPEGRKYLVKPLNFKGPCTARSLTALISGTVVAPLDPWNPLDSWLQFSHVEGITIQGRGIVDGSGQKWWAYNCRNYKSQRCVKRAPIAMAVRFCQKVIIKDLTFQNSPGVHIKLFASKDVEVSNLQISGPEDSPNTDGINIASSQQIVVRNSKIGTGDDCVSIITGSSDIQIKDLICGPGHGISIGSLGKNGARDTVSNVVVRGAHLSGTTNGLRIKTWQGGSGYAQDISYEDVTMNNVSNPIIIDQYYCDRAGVCRNQTSAVQVSNVSYIGISGTSATQEAIRLACSSTVPCTNIVMKEINLRTNKGIPSTAFVDHVRGFTRDGLLNPHL